MVDVGLFRRPGWSVGGVVFTKDVAAPGGGGGAIENRACSSSLADSRLDAVVGAGRRRELLMLMVWPGFKL